MFLIFWTFLFVAGEVVATTYYVSNSGLDSNLGTETHPFKTIQKAADIVNPGDTVIVKDGVYTDMNNDKLIVKITRGGNSNAWVTFISENKHGAILDGNNNKSNFGFYFFNKRANYIKIEGFEIRGTLWGAISNNVKAHHLIIKDNYIHDVGRAYRKDGQPGFGIINPGGGGDVIIDGNILKTNGRLRNDPAFSTDSNQDHSIYLGGGGSNYTIKNNIFSDHISGFHVVWYGDLAGNVNVISNTFSDPNHYRDGHILITRDQIGPVLIKDNTFNYPRNGAISCYKYTAGTIRLSGNTVIGNADLVTKNCKMSLFENIVKPLMSKPPKLIKIKYTDG